jgi:hypothetical protein
MPIDIPDPEYTAALQDRIHAVLIREFAREPAIAMAGALSYELVEMLRSAPISLPDARAVLDSIAAVMRRQLDTFGTGQIY